MRRARYWPARGVDLAVGSLIGALLAGLLARAAAERHGAQAVAFAVPGTVAMIPGSYGFRAGIGGLRLAALVTGAPPALVVDTIGLSITTATMTAAIAIGLCLAFACPLPTTPSLGRLIWPTTSRIIPR